MPSIYLESEYRRLTLAKKVIDFTKKSIIAMFMVGVFITGLAILVWLIPQ